MTDVQTVDKKNIIAVVLTGKRDFGRCPIASSYPAALWPVMGKPALQCLLDCLAEQGIQQAVICSYGDSAILQEAFTDYHAMKLAFLEEELPLGTAGCIRYAVTSKPDFFDQGKKTLLIFQGSMVNPPNVDHLLETHTKHNAILTVVLDPQKDPHAPGSDVAGIYACDPKILDFIPQDGYCDIKETLIPTLIQAGQSIETVNLADSVGSFREKDGYLLALTQRMGYPTESGPVDRTAATQTCDGVWIDPTAQVDPSATFLGAVKILKEAKVESGAVICGPTIIEQKACVGKNTLIDHSVVWPSARIGHHCEIQRCLIDQNASVPSESVLQDQAVSYKKSSIVQIMVDQLSGFQLTGMVILIVALLYSYWPQLTELFQIWQRSDEYGSGALVPVIAVTVLWMRRRRLAICPVKPLILWGIFALVLIQCVRFYGLWSWLRSLERLSLVMTIIALVMMLFGWKMLRRCLAVLLFLFLMVPFPNSVQYAITQPLQSWATHSAVFSLEMIGYDVKQQGNIIHLRSDDVDQYTSVAVAEACNGLRMVTAFFVVCGLVALLYTGPLWHKVVGMLSCLPIALLCNTVRLTITAIMFTFLDGPQWETIFHDFGGYAMMPLAIVIIMMEFWFLTKLFLVPPEAGDAVQHIIVRT